MTTTQELIDDVRRDYLTQGRVEPRNKLATAVDASETTFTMAYALGNIASGSLLSIGLEDCYVWSTDDGSKTVTVDRGVDGTTAASHTTTERVRVTPRWTDAQILRSVNNELANLYAQGLYQIATTEFTFTSANVGYELPAATLGVWRVWTKDYAFKNWVRLDGWEVDHAANTTTFPSGVALFLRNGAYEGRTVRVQYRAAFTALTTLAQDVVAVTGLPSTAVDVLRMGIAVSALVGREVGQRLLESQGSTRRAEEVPPGALAQSFTPIIRNYQARVRAERATLVRKYGAT